PVTSTAKKAPVATSPARAMAHSVPPSAGAAQPTCALPSAPMVARIGKSKWPCTSTVTPPAGVVPGVSGSATGEDGAACGTADGPAAGGWPPGGPGGGDGGAPSLPVAGSGGTPMLCAGAEVPDVATGAGLSHACAGPVPRSATTATSPATTNARFA